jgi:hypothetical protein
MLIHLTHDISPLIKLSFKTPKSTRGIDALLGMEYEKIDAYEDNCVLFYKEHKDETKYLKCGKSMFVEVVNEDGEKVTMKVAHKQLRYMPLTPRMKWLFLSNKTARHMR